MTSLERFVETFGVWEEARPFIETMFSDLEMQLIVGMQRQSLTAEAVAELLEIPPGQALALLGRCHERCIVDKSDREGIPGYTAASFYSFLNHFAMYEHWDDLPAADRTVIDLRFLDEFISKHKESVGRKMQDMDSEADGAPNDTVLLLTEVEEMLNASTHIVLLPCDCRRLGQRCDRPVETCIWLDDAALGALDRGHGRRLAKDEAIDLVRWADRKGLMHTADGEWRTRGLHAICNCCACDCYPFRAARELGSKGVWPKSRYIAVYDPERCNLCGACVKRCHFDAFYHDGSVDEMDGAAKKNVLYEPERCWGCGLCANTCPSDAIVMEALV